MRSIAVGTCWISRKQLEVPFSQKQKKFSGFFLAFQKCALNLEHFEKKRWVSSPSYFQNYWLRKRWLLKRLKGFVSEHHSVINVLTGSKHCWNELGTTISLFSHEFEVNWAARVCYSLIWNLNTVCSHYEYRRQVFPSKHAEFQATTWSAIISKTKHIFWIFSCISEMSLKFRILGKKRWVS